MNAAPISDYALLSDCQGAALVSRGGSIDWWCAPRFDSPSLFGRLLDHEAGHWSLRPAAPATIERSYLDDTMVVETTFTTDQGQVRLIDALAFAPGARGHQIGLESPHTLVRTLTAISGEVDMRMEYAPRPHYGAVVPRFAVSHGSITAVGDGERLVMIADVPVQIDGDAVTAAFRLCEGDSAGFSLRHQPGFESDGLPPAAASARDETIAGWRSWNEMHLPYLGRWSDHVRRSTIVLQALTYQPTGAIVAAPTTSLPEVVGGSSNWDYRFAWLRDASMTLHALWIAACPDEAARNFLWMADAVGDGGEHVQIVFGVDGERDLTESELPYLRGYRGSQPVRVGNDAWKQVQLDVFGEILASAYLLRDQLAQMEPKTIAFLCDMADAAADRWRDADAGIWEGREGERDYLSSKLMCWVALDRAVALVDLLGADATRLRRWVREREAIRAAILDRGWDEGVQAYTGAFGSDHLDASVLLMPIVGFVPADDERMALTIDAIERELSHDGLVQRWTGADDGGFVICSFWLADCLARMGRVDRAEEVFESAIACANDVGLLSEEVDLSDRQLIGNFPQGLSHVGLILAAWSIDRARETADNGAAAHSLTTPGR